jgi:DNA-binding NarL/FixJ family response regulator
MDSNSAFNPIDTTSLSSLLVIARKSTLRESLELVLSTIRDNPAYRIGRLEYAETLPEGLAGGEQPDLVIFDTNPNHEDALKQIRVIRQQFPNARLLVLADISLWQALKKTPGLDGLLLKGFSSSQLIDMIGKLTNPGESRVK